MMDIANIIGYAATVVGTCLMLPQVIKSWKTKRVADVSLLMLVFYFFNCLLWGIYGVLIHAIPVIVANTMGFLVSIVQLGLKLKYGKKRK
ncbi:MAG: SemiSWEET family transporter [Nanoarchaeota archaeon]